MHAEIGEAAGVVWRDLETHRAVTLPGLKRSTKLADPAADSLNAFREALAWAPEGALAHHAARGDFSRWVLDVFSDRALGHQIRKLEARWTRSEIRDLRRGLQQLVALRYGTEG